MLMISTVTDPLKIELLLIISVCVEEQEGDQITLLGVRKHPLLQHFDVDLVEVLGVQLLEDGLQQVLLHLDEVHLLCLPQELAEAGAYHDIHLHFVQVVTVGVLAHVLQDGLQLFLGGLAQGDTHDLQELWP